MNRPEADVVVAGHICLDILPAIDASIPTLGSLVAAGRLTQVGRAEFSLGGCAANTGLALYKLGIRTSLIAQVGEDRVGALIQGLLAEYGPQLSRGLRVVRGVDSSYTIVLSTSKDDRAFLHCPGANEQFSPRDISPQSLDGAKILHFGYPPIMPRTYEDHGAALEDLFQSAADYGTLVSLDMAMPDLRSRAGQVDWTAWHRRVLPAVDLFMPGFEETMAMLHTAEWVAIAERRGINPAAGVSMQRLCELCDQLIGLGAKVVVLKLGDQGLLLRSASPREEKIDSGWYGRQLYAPCFDVQLVGATGAGDCATAGLLAALVHGQTVESAVKSAAAVGACSVLSHDATSSVPSWPVVQQNAVRWKTRPPRPELADWVPDELGILHGPEDRST